MKCIEEKTSSIGNARSLIISGSGCPVSDRFIDYPEYGNGYSGVRAYMYIKW